MEWTTPRCDVPDGGERPTTVRVKKNRGALAFRHLFLFSKYKRYWHRDRPAQARVAGFCCVVWGEVRALRFFPCAEKRWNKTIKSFLYMVKCVSAEPCFGISTFPLSDFFKVLKILQYLFPCRGPSVSKASFPSPRHSPSFSVLWIHCGPSLCFLAILNWSSLCLGNHHQQLTKLRYDWYSGKYGHLHSLSYKSCCDLDFHYSFRFPFWINA